MNKIKKFFSTETRERNARAVGNEILPQHITLKGTYFICNLYLYFLMWKKTTMQHIMLKGTLSLLFLFKEVIALFQLHID